jgi:hypothetical protein
MATKGSAVATGDLALRQAVERFPQQVQLALRAVAWRTSRDVMAHAKAGVPVDTGYTRDHIHIVEEPEKKRFLVNAGTDQPRVQLSLHRMKRSGRTHTQKVTLNMLPEWLEFGFMRRGRHYPGRPFMRPAAAAAQPGYERQMMAAATTTAERELGGR